ncbi:hypothetical protein AUJ69_02975 [Candidatus Woesearchaeota archaeon CG1_02_47_18]|nr:MAG: hypothetical protein AUJ69_02975 [Candidatus Woesearchaeota archaeon CG1_02_47_18]HII30116.1 HEPN domain-containing protein [Candidatus Woesearchaeota archaeon]
MEKENKKLKWCFGIKGGLKILEPNERLARSYLNEAKQSLERAEKNFNDGDLLWATVVIYYAEYYALYSFLQRIGVKCENHACSILAASFILGSEKTQTINKHKDKRIDAQYYMRVDKEEKVKQTLREAKIFVALFDDLVSNIGEEEINSYRASLKKVREDNKNTV